MNPVAQLTVIAIFLGLAVYLAKDLPKRVVLVINAFAAGSVLFFIISTISGVIGRMAELFQSSTFAGGIFANPWVFTILALAAIFATPLIMIFVVGERRRSVILAVALGLFNLGFALTVGNEVSSGILNVTAGPGILLAVFFLLEGLAIGALLLNAQPSWLLVAGLGATATVPALIGFNMPALGSLDVFVPFAYAAAAGFLLFYLPFILGLNDKNTPNDIKWHFVGLLTGLFCTGLIYTAFNLLGQ